MTVFDINDYRTACKFLQGKYDAMGIERLNYFHYNSKGNYAKNNKVGHGNEGLQYHHICEDIVPSLSTESIAIANDQNFQKAENMCYCNLLEHAWLHLLITENADANTSVDADDLTGLGGVKWMMLALNSIMSNADTSWYSSKNEEGKGCNYNYNNIITDNEDDYYKVINRFCTSPFIRQRLDKTPEELANLICLLPRKDQEDFKLDIFKTILKHIQTELFTWNVNAYADLEMYLRNDKSALVYICTGGGKTTTALEYLRVHNAKALVLGPSNTIGDGWENAKKYKKQITYMNYQTFMNKYKMLNWNNIDVIICDEAHHIKADRWGEGVRWALANTDVKLIGLSATPTTAQFNGKDEEFAGRICNGLDLQTGISEGNIYPFSYVQSIYRMEDVKDEFDKYGSVGTQLWNKLNLQMNENPIDVILRKHMPNGIRKIVVFCSSIADMKYAKGIMQTYDPTLEIRVLSSYEDQVANEEAREWFNNTLDKNVCILTVNMVNEGAHYKGVNTLIMFRRTNSYTLYLQQLGRIVVTTKDSEGNVRVNPNGIVFDFTNNAENLIYRSQKNEETHTNISIEKIQEIVTTIKSLSGKEVIYKDYTEDCVRVLTALAENNTDAQSAKIINAFTYNEGEDALELVFDADLWDGYKEKKVNGAKKASAPKAKVTHAKSAATKNAFDNSHNDEESKASNESKVATDIKQRIVAAFKLALKRAWLFKAIKFNTDLTVFVNDENELKDIVSGLGFTDYTAFVDTLIRMKDHTFIIATQLAK